MKEGMLQLISQKHKRIIRYYQKQLYANKLDNPKEMDKLLKIYNLLRLDHEEMVNSNN